MQPRRRRWKGVTSHTGFSTDVTKISADTTYLEVNGRQGVGRSPCHTLVHSNPCQTTVFSKAAVVWSTVAEIARMESLSDVSELDMAVSSSKMEFTNIASSEISESSVPVTVSTVECRGTDVAQVVPVVVRGIDTVTASTNERIPAVLIEPSDVNGTTCTIDAVPRVAETQSEHTCECESIIRSDIAEETTPSNATVEDQPDPTMKTPARVVSKPVESQMSTGTVPLVHSPDDKAAMIEATPAVDAAEAIAAPLNDSHSAVVAQSRPTGPLETNDGCSLSSKAGPRPQRPRRQRMRQEIRLGSPQSAPNNGHHCIIHTPTLEELRKTTFSNYVRSVVLPSAAAAAAAAANAGNGGGSSSSSSIPTNTAANDSKPPYSGSGNGSTAEAAMELREGVAKIRLPKGFFNPPYGTDTTGRGPVWQAGTPLGDKQLENPIQQNIRGMTGVYEYTHTILPSTTLAEFRERADKYRKVQMGSVLLEFKSTDTESATGELMNAKNETSSPSDAASAQVSNKTIAPAVNSGELTPPQVAMIERQFWRQLSPTMPPPVYGADEAGTLFGNDPATGWSLANLDSCLHVLPDAGMWASVFCAHSEDMNLLSINYLHAGLPKFWYTVAEPDAARFVSLAEHHFVHQVKQCKEFLRHKRCLLSPEILKTAGIRYQTAVQYPGDAIITFPGSYHFGFNAGFNIAEATNFGIPEWLPFGRRAKICLCRPDSVRIDMNRLAGLLQRYQKDAKRNRRLTWKDWRKRQERKEGVTNAGPMIQETEDEIIEIVPYSPKKRARSSKKDRLSEQQMKNEYWIEVMRPSELTKAAAAKKKGGSKREENPWHLAKPIGRKRLEVNAKVLCLIPAPLADVPPTPSSTTDTTGNDDDVSSDEEIVPEENEYCLAGTVAQIADGHVLVHFNGMNKSENKWVPLNSPKLFLDGGRWQEEHEAEGMPALHYWKEMDSKMLL
jgi:JmjC domain, hydroxylase